MTYSVIVIRDEDQLIPAKYINRFFKLCGIYTYDYAMPQHAGNSGFPDCFGFDCIILMTHQSNAKASLKTYSNQSIVEFPVPADANLSDREKRKEFGKEAKAKVLETVGDDLTDTYDIFVDEDVAYLDFMLRWRVAPDRLDDSVNLCSPTPDVDGVSDSSYTSSKLRIDRQPLKSSNESGKAGELSKVGRGLSSIDDWLSVCNKLPFDGCVQQRYAYLNCCRKVNKICAECRQIAVFDDSKLMAAAVKLCEEDKRFTIAYVLAGLIGLRNPDTESQAEQYLQQVIEREKGVVYADFVYYVLGEYYEVDRHDWMFGWMWYQRMVGCPLQERRGKPVSDGMYNIKLSNRMIQTGQTDEAWKILTEMKEKLEEKYTLGYISLDEVSMWYQCTRMMEDMQRFFRKKYVLSGMPSDSIIGAIDRNAEIWNFADKDDRQDVIQAVRTKTEKK